MKGKKDRGLVIFWIRKTLSTRGLYKI